MRSWLKLVAVSAAYLLVIASAAGDEVVSSSNPGLENKRLRSNNLRRTTTQQFELNSHHRSIESEEMIQDLEEDIELKDAEMEMLEGMHTKGIPMPLGSFWRTKCLMYLLL